MVAEVPGDLIFELARAENSYYTMNSQVSVTFICY
jgi:hypothetical protein